MTATADLMAQLQAAWRTVETRPTARIEKAPPLIVTTTTTETATTVTRSLDVLRDEPKSPPRCVSHLDPTLWVSRPVDDGSGRVETTCSLCGVFIGFGPSDRQRMKLQKGV